MNLPSQLRDNMGGPGQGGGEGGGGGPQLFPPDMAVAIEADKEVVSGYEPFTISVFLSNVYYDPFGDIQIDLTLPPNIEYLSHSIPAGSAFVDTNSDGVPDLWQVDSLGNQQVIQMEIEARGALSPTFEEPTLQAEIVEWTGTDSHSANNTSTFPMELIAFPLLTTTKVSSASSTLPGGNISYTLATTNLAEAEAYDVKVTTTISPHLYFRLDTFGPGEPFRFTEGAIPSGLATGTPEFSDDGGDEWDYTPMSGAGGAPAGYDGNVTNWRMTMSGVMAADGASFDIEYEALVR